MLSASTGSPTTTTGIFQPTNGKLNTTERSNIGIKFNPGESVLWEFVFIFRTKNKVWQGKCYDFLTGLYGMERRRVFAQICAVESSLN